MYADLCRYNTSVTLRPLLAKSYMHELRVLPDDVSVPEWCESVIFILQNDSLFGYQSKKSTRRMGTKPN